MSTVIRRDRYVRGQWNATSDRDGQKRKSSDMRLEWTGAWVGKEEWEPRHPQMILRPRVDRPARSPVRNTEPGNLVITAFTNSEIV